MILTHFLMQQLQYFEQKIPRELLGGEQGRTFGIKVANQSMPSTVSTFLVYTNTNNNNNNNYYYYYYYYYYYIISPLQCLEHPIF